MKIRNVVCRHDDIPFINHLNNRYPYGIEIVEEGVFFESLKQEEELYDYFLLVLDKQGNAEQFFETKAEALNSWLAIRNRELIESLI